MSDGIPQEVLDGLQAEIQAQKSGEMMQVQEVIEEDPPEEIQEELEPLEDEEQVLPENYKTLEDYIADGGDPDYYRGPKAFEKDRELIGEVKEIKRKLKERDNEMLALVDFQEKERERLLSEIKEKKAQAKENLDFDAYETLDQQARDLEQPEKPAQQGEPDVIKSYRQANPKINPASAEYDPVHDSMFAAAFNAMVMSAEQRAGRALTESEIQGYLDATAKRVGGEKPTATPRPSKVAGTKRSAKKADPVAALPPEVQGLYKRWMSDPKKKEFAANLLKQHQAG